MIIERVTITDNWIRINILGSMLFSVFIAIYTGFEISKIGYFFVIFLIVLVISQVLFLPKLLLINLITLECNKQSLTTKQYLTRIIIALVLTIFLTVAVLILIFPIFPFSLYFTLGLSYLVPGIYLWSRTLINITNKKVINEEVIDDGNLL